MKPDDPGSQDALWDAYGARSFVIPTQRIKKKCLFIRLELIGEASQRMEQHIDLCCVARCPLQGLEKQVLILPEKFRSFYFLLVCNQVSHFSGQTLVVRHEQVLVFCMVFHKLFQVLRCLDPPKICEREDAGKKMFADAGVAYPPLVFNRMIGEEAEHLPSEKSRTFRDWCW